MPVGEISRHSALGSHAPLEFTGPEKEVQEEEKEVVEKRPTRPRRATLPSIVGPNPESLVDSGYHENRQSFLYNGQKIDPGDIGFAVTSGSNPKRRSRSVDAFAARLDLDRMSPLPWQDYMRRSDDIRYWRNSIGPATAPGQKEENTGNATTTNEPVEMAVDVAPESFFEDDNDDDDKEIEPEHIQQDNRDTFDFGIVASTMRQQEDLPLEERMMTVEVKLMDLEYAISKLQTNAPPLNQLTSDRHPDPSRPLEVPTAEASVQVTPGRQSPISTHKSHIGSRSTNSDSISTQPTAVSLTSPPSHPHNDDPFVDYKPRPTSQAPTVRHLPISPIPSERNFPSSEPRPRSSLTNISVDHLTTLITLIRTEQAARQRLESQVMELQREIKFLQHQQHLQHQPRQQPPYPMLHSPKSATSFSRPRAWTAERREGAVLDFSLPRRMQSYDDTASTDDGFQDVYETPTEQKRGEFEGGVINGVEGEAF